MPSNVWQAWQFIAAKAARPRATSVGFVSRFDAVWCVSEAAGSPSSSHAAMRQVEIGHASSRATAERISDESAQGTKIVFRWQMVKVMGQGRLVTLFHRVGSVARDAAQVLVGLLAFEDEA